MERIVLTHAGATDHDYSLHEGSFDALKKRLLDARRGLSAKTPYHFLSFADDTEFLKKLRNVKDAVDSPKVKKIFIVGIGGANLASEAVIHAFPKNLDREFLFLDTLYPGERDDIVTMTSSIQHIDECAIIVISKSGNTIETLTNTELLLTILEDRLGSLSKRTIVVTGEHSQLATWARGKRIATVFLPDAVSDRFGAFSPLGIVPMLFANFAVEDFLKGAGRALDANLSPEANHELGPAWKIAIALDKKAKQEKRMVLDLFFFSKRLETLGKWHRQLFAESLGKETTITGRENPYNLTPTVSVGTTDLHSVLQLYLAEPQGRFAWFMPVRGDFHRSAEDNESFDSFLFGLAGNSPERTLGMIYQSITEEYAHHSLPFVETGIDTISEESLGFAMMNAMIVVVALAHLWSIDPFTQPQVEHYKETVRNELAEDIQSKQKPVSVQGRKVHLNLKP